ncbi:Uncharacterized protein Rs2_04977 [Raphanus sativus]|nr:Uncharacterized protein Rs2_04977 [Raphanus sativus]
MTPLTTTPKLSTEHLTTVQKALILWTRYKQLHLVRIQTSAPVNSVIYDKADHPDIPKINHLLYHGVWIYDPLSPDPPLSNPPMFDSTIGPSSPSGTRLRLSPLPFRPLTTPVKSNDSGLGFASHAATPNDFTAITSSNSPPCIGRPTSAEEANEDGVVDLTHPKNPPRHVPSAEENHITEELSSSPLVPAQALITTLPEMERDLFHNVRKTNINVKSTKKSTFSLEQRVIEIVVRPGNKWMDDVHTIYTHMLWNESH